MSSIVANSSAPPLFDRDLRLLVFLCVVFGIDLYIVYEYFFGITYKVIKDKFFCCIVYLFIVLLACMFTYYSTSMGIP
jgi:hypothetical protein